MTPEELKQRRTELGLTQAQMAEKLPVNTRTYQAWEAGRFKVPPFLARAIQSIEEEVKKK